MLAQEVDLTWYTVVLQERLGTWLCFAGPAGEIHNKAKYDRIRPKTVSESLDLAGHPEHWAVEGVDCILHTQTRSNKYWSRDAAKNEGF